jgi:hypothetical protein
MDAQIDATTDLLGYFGISSIAPASGYMNESFEHLVSHLPGGMIGLFNDGKLDMDVSQDSKLMPLLHKEPPLHWVPDDLDLAQNPAAVDMRPGKQLGLKQRIAQSEKKHAELVNLQKQQQKLMEPEASPPSAAASSGDSSGKKVTKKKRKKEDAEPTGSEQPQRKKKRASVSVPK